MTQNVNILDALARWEAKYQKEMTLEELAKQAGIRLASLKRLIAGNPTSLDMQKLDKICAVLECMPGDLVIADSVGEMRDSTRIEVERRRVLSNLEARTKKRTKYYVE
ncbi:MAG: XRE family transcriptional regulator [Chloroflexi bacterium]|nr:MAG: XRE family transcriptional regulator [Chloroflexota bacterium]